MNIIPKRLISWILVPLGLVAACSFGASEEEIAEISAEAQIDFPIIEQALANHYDSNKVLPDLSELDLDEEVLNPNNDSFSYRYRRGRDYLGGPRCKYSLSAFVPSDITSSKAVYVVDETFCDPDDLARATAESKKIFEEASEELLVVQQALEGFLELNGVYPPALTDLGLAEGDITNSVDNKVYWYLPFDGKANDELKPQEICSYYLSVNQVPVSLPEYEQRKKVNSEHSCE